jgi:hypothetical protein
MHADDLVLLSTASEVLSPKDTRWVECLSRGSVLLRRRFQSSKFLQSVDVGGLGIPLLSSLTYRFFVSSLSANLVSGTAFNIRVIMYDVTNHKRCLDGEYKTITEHNSLAARSINVFLFRIIKVLACYIVSEFATP